MSDKLEAMSRRRALSLVGLAALSLAVPTVFTVSDATVSDAEAQAAPPTAPPAQAPTAGPRNRDGAASGATYTPCETTCCAAHSPQEGSRGPT
jgi:hypothetical protein